MGIWSGAVLDKQFLWVTSDSKQLLKESIGLVCVLVMSKHAGSINAIHDFG